jgi:iron(III) transport system permease protein
MPMTSCMVLEAPGRWRAGSLVLLLALPALPAVSLLWFSLTTSTHFSCGGAVFERALVNSAVVALLVALGSFGLGLPVGVLNALYEYRGRRLLLVLSLLPLLVPSFLWARGWPWLLAREARWLLPVVSGHFGCALVFLPGAVALVLFTSVVSTAALSASQVEAARLAGGEGTLFRLACRHASVPAGLAAVLAAVLSLSDPGAGFAVGLKVAATEILISFSAFYNYSLAGQQCLLLALLVLAAALPIARLAARRLVTPMPARQLRPARRELHRVGATTAGAALFALVFVLTLLPSVGLILPLRRWAELARAFGDLAATGLNTLLYAAGAGFCAAGLALALAFCAGREERLRRWSIGFCLGLFALPPMLSALGFVRWAAGMPAWTDPLLRGRPAVCLVLGMHFFPVAALLILRSWGSVAPALAWTAGVHGVSLGRYVWRVVLPRQHRVVVTAVMLVGLLATAEIGMVLLLYPPGEETLPLHIFQIIGNAAPSQRLAALCAVDLLIAAALLFAIWILGEGKPA